MFPAIALTSLLELLASPLASPANAVSISPLANRGKAAQGRVWVQADRSEAKGITFNRPVVNEISDSLVYLVDDKGKVVGDPNFWVTHKVNSGATEKSYFTIEGTLTGALVTDHKAVFNFANYDSYLYPCTAAWGIQVRCKDHSLDQCTPIPGVRDWTPVGNVDA